MPYEKLNNCYHSDYYTSIKEDFSIYSSLNCSNRRPTKKNQCFCSEPLKNSIYPQCKKYEGKTNQCMETVCCNSCNLNKQNLC